MTDFIDRQRAIETICLAICEENKPCDCECTEITILKKLPSAERRGRWEREVLGSTSGYGTTVMYQCSVCGRMSISKYHFCPNCGAKMREQKREEPEINPCRGCSDYDEEGGCKSNGACGARMEENE